MIELLNELGNRPMKKRYPQEDLARRLCDAMDESGVSYAALARGCGVTIQAVYNWRHNGRIAKQHLMTIATLTRKPIEYFLVGLRAATMLVALVFCVPQPSDASVLHNENYRTFYTFRDLWLRLIRRIVGISRQTAPFLR